MAPALIRCPFCKTMSPDLVSSPLIAIFSKASNCIVLQKGQRINAGAIAVLATYGYTEVPVYNKPSVAIIATGSELLDVGDELEPGKIRNSNGPMISALAQNLGLTIETYKIQQDDLGFPESPNKYFPCATATVVTLPGLIATLLNKTFASKC